VIQPKVLLLDEPLSALDKKLREEMQFWVKNLQQSIGITTIYVTHDQVEAMTVSDTMAVMNKGRVEQVGTPREIYENPQTKFIANFIGESNIFEGKITAQVDGRSQVTFGTLTAVIPSMDGYALDQSASLVLRPEKIILGDDAIAMSENRFKGEVKALTFRGPIVRYLISLEGQQDIIVDSQRTAERSIFQVGETVDLSWAPEDATVLED
jgi:putative spermidine/putrescine transport system ATP-binding protein